MLYICIQYTTENYQADMTISSTAINQSNLLK